MSQRIEDALAAAIARVRAGQSTIEEELARYPDLAMEVEPLLRLAAAIKAPNSALPSPMFRSLARARLMRTVGGAPVTERPFLRVLRWNDLHLWWNNLFRLGRAKMKLVAVAISLMFVVAVGGSGAYAAQISMPGDLLYPVKTGLEQVTLTMATSDEAKTSAHLDVAERRLGEMETLASSGHWAKAAPLAAVVTYHLAMASEMMERHEAAGYDVTSQMARLRRASGRLEALQSTYGAMATGDAARQMGPTDEAGMMVGGASAMPGPLPTTMPMMSGGGPAMTLDEMPSRWDDMAGAQGSPMTMTAGMMSNTATGEMPTGMTSDMAPSAMSGMMVTPVAQMTATPVMTMMSGSMSPGMGSMSTPTASPAMPMMTGSTAAPTPSPTPLPMMSTTSTSSSGSGGMMSDSGGSSTSGSGGSTSGGGGMMSGGGMHR